MKIILSKKQWIKIGQKTNWLDYTRHYLDQFLQAQIFAINNKHNRQTIRDDITQSTVDYVDTPYGRFILSLDTPEQFRNRGGATRVIKKALNCKSIIYLEADASDPKKGLNQQQLIDFYRKFGFKIISGNKMMKD